MKKYLIWMILCLLLVFSIAGCQVEKDEQGNTQYRLDPNDVEKYEKGAATGITLAQLLSSFYPALLPFVTAAAGVLGMWIKQRPKFTEYKTTNLILHDGAASFVELLEQIKKESPDMANTLLAKMEVIKNKFISPKDLSKFEAIIRGLRGLPPKA